VLETAEIGRSAPRTGDGESGERQPEGDGGEGEETSVGLHGGSPVSRWLPPL
jgi:hypothetical protein